MTDNDIFNVLNAGGVICYAPVTGGQALLDKDGGLVFGIPIETFLRLRQEGKIRFTKSMRQGHHIFHGQVDFYKAAETMIVIPALTLWDPWAWLIRLLLKEYETRGWGTSYRGPLLICAAKRPVDLGMLQYINRILIEHGHAPIAANDLRPGHAVALVDLVDDIKCHWVLGHLQAPEKLSAMEFHFGDFSSNRRHALKLENVRPITPFPVTGRQRLFNMEVPEELLR